MHCLQLNFRVQRRILFESVIQDSRGDAKCSQRHPANSYGLHDSRARESLRLASAPRNSAAPITEEVDYDLIVAIHEKSADQGQSAICQGDELHAISRPLPPIRSSCFWTDRQKHPSSPVFRLTPHHNCRRPVCMTAQRALWPKTTPPSPSLRVNFSLRPNQRSPPPIVVVVDTCWSAMSYSWFCVVSLTFRALTFRVSHTARQCDSRPREASSPRSDPRRPNWPKPH